MRRWPKGRQQWPKGQPQQQWPKGQPQQQWPKGSCPTGVCGTDAITPTDDRELAELNRMLDLMER